MTNQEYNVLVKSKSPNSKLGVNMLKAFLIGGLICAFGQVLLLLYSSAGAEEKTASTLVSVTLIFLSVVLTGLGLYYKIAKHGGAGTLVPITGFANAVASPAIEYKSEGQILGVGAKMFTIAGPVIVFGVMASVLYGVILWVWQMLV